MPRSVARFAGSIILLLVWYLGLAPQALCCRALRALCGEESQNRRPDPISLEKRRVKLRKFLRRFIHVEMDLRRGPFPCCGCYLGPNKKIRPQASICWSNHDQFC